jgi:tRNA nucleotidyltransferase (CCA-adding enzyme)
MDAFAQCRPQNSEDAITAGLAVLCHDFGKPHCTHWNEGGRLGARGHELAGTILARGFLSHMRVPNGLIDRVLPLVECHMIPRLFSDPRSATPFAVRRLAHRVGRIDLLLLVARCDGWGRPPIIPDFSADWQLEALARRENLWDQGPKPLVLGRDLLHHFSLTPSPMLGKYLAEIFEAQLDGKFSTQKDGLRWAEKIIAKRPRE